MPNGEGLFNLSAIDQAGEGDILQANINESGEFAPGSYDTNDVSNHTTPAKISVPGGDGEAPSAKPEGGEHGPTPPGGDGEKPTAKPEGGERGPSIPKKTELTTDQWNHAMSLLKQSFKEGMEIMEMLESCHIVEETTEQKQERFIQESMDQAYYEALINGPYYEAAGDRKKPTIKGIVSVIKSKASKISNKFVTANKMTSIAKKDKSVARDMWKTVGMIPASEKKIVAKLNKALKGTGFKVTAKEIKVDEAITEAFHPIRSAKNIARGLSNAGKAIKGAAEVAEEVGKNPEAVEGAKMMGAYLQLIIDQMGDPDSYMSELMADESYQKAITQALEKLFESGKNDDDDDKCPECGKDPCECDKDKGKKGKKDED